METTEKKSIKASELAELQKKAAQVDVLSQKFEELEKKVQAATVVKETTPAEKLDGAEEYQKKVRAIEEERKNEKIEAYRKGTVEGLVKDEITKQNRLKFDGAFGRVMQEETLGVVVKSIGNDELYSWMTDPVYGEENRNKEIVKRVNDELKKRQRYVEEISARYEAKNIANAATDPAFRINALSSAAKQYGELKEEAYLSDANSKAFSVKQKLNDILLTKMLKAPVLVTESGVIKGHILDPFRPMLQEAIARQHVWEEMSGAAENHFFARGGRLFEMINSPIAKKNLTALMEADESTTSFFLGGSSISYLPIDVAGTIISGAWPRMLMKQVAAEVGTMSSPNKRFYDVQYPRGEEPLRATRHFFGYVDHASATTLASGSMADGTDATDDTTFLRASGHIPQPIYAVLGEVVSAAATITFTGTDQNGDSATATVAFAATDAVGTVKIVVPSNLGTRFMDVSAVSMTTGLSTGQIGVFAPEQVSGHSAGAAAQKARTKALPYDVTEKTYDLQSNIDINLIEDTQIALAQNGAEGLNYVALILEMISNEVHQIIDSEGFDNAVINAYANNILTFDATTPTEGLSVAEWKEQFHFNLDILFKTVLHFSGAEPDWILMNTQDVPYVREWMRGTGKMTVLDPLVNDPFANGRAQGKILNADWFASENVPLKRVLVGSRGKRTGLHSYDYVPLKVFSAPDPTAAFTQVVMVHTRGFHGVAPASSGKPSSGRSLGVLKLTR